MGKAKGMMGGLGRRLLSHPELKTELAGKRNGESLFGMPAGLGGMAAAAAGAAAPPPPPSPAAASGGGSCPPCKCGSGSGAAGAGSGSGSGSKAGTASGAAKPKVPGPTSYPPTTEMPTRLSPEQIAAIAAGHPESRADEVAFLDGANG